jgi:DNA-binding MarR family transcriptional regulator
MTLAYIAHTPGINRAALARELAISPQATGNLAAQLQADGLITRTRHQPGQPTLHQVTPHGTRTLAAAAPTVQDVDRDLAKRLSPAHRHLLAQLVSHLLTTYTDI